MKSNRTTTRRAVNAGPGPPAHTWTRARLKALTGSQVKALFLVASESRPRSSARSSERAAEVERLIADMSRRHGIPSGAVLEQAASKTTSVQDLIRIKELAKALAQEAEDRRHREAAQLLYHVTVAAAFVNHTATISGRPMQKQQALYEKFAVSWAGQTIGRLFREAATRVAYRTGSDAG